MICSNMVWAQAGLALLSMLLRGARGCGCLWGQGQGTGVEGDLLFVISALVLFKLF